MSDNPSAQHVEPIDVNAFLPSAEDHEEILKNFAIIAGRIIVKYFFTFEKIPSLTKEHITHCFYTEMSKQSKVVSGCNNSGYFTAYPDNMASFPGLPCFYLLFAFTIIYRRTLPLLCTGKTGNEAILCIQKNRYKCIFNIYLLSTGSFRHNHEK